MTTTDTRTAINSTKAVLRDAICTAILKGDLDDATILLDMLKRFEVEFVDVKVLTPHEEELVRAGHKIDAIKTVRGRLVGMSLKEAADLVNSEMERLGVNPA